MANFIKSSTFKRLDSGEITADNVYLIVHDRIIVGERITSLDDKKEQVNLALELIGENKATLSDYVIVYNVTFDSVSPNSVTQMASLLIRKRDISAIVLGGYAVIDGNWTEEERKALKAQKAQQESAVKNKID
jgi:hypothetical protein